MVAVPHGRKRWSKVVETIEHMPWVTCELLAKDGSIVGYVANDGASGEVEELADGRPHGHAQYRWFLEMMIKAQSVAMSAREKEFASVLNAMQEMISVNSQATKELVELYRVQRDVVAETAMTAAQGEGDIAQIVKLIEASPDLIRMLAPLVMKLGKPKLPPGPPTGAKS